MAGLLGIGCVLSQFWQVLWAKIRLFSQHLLANFTGKVLFSIQQIAVFRPVFSIDPTLVAQAQQTGLHQKTLRGPTLLTSIPFQAISTLIFINGSYVLPQIQALNNQTRTIFLSGKKRFVSAKYSLFQIWS